MAESIFPFMQSVKYSEGVSSPYNLPLYTDVSWDDQNNRANLDENGLPIFVSKNEALRGWIVRALRTVRYAEEMHTWQFGSELDSLIGRPWLAETRIAEAKHYISECLCQNPYILACDVTSAAFAGDKLTISLTVHTIYSTFDMEELNV